MTSFDERIEYYEKIKAEKEAGKYHYIPFAQYLPRLAKYMPGVIPGIGFQILANSGIGKSKLFRYMFIQIPYAFIKANPQAGITFKVIVNALEETVEELIDSFIINRIKLKYNYDVTINDLNGFSETPLPTYILQDIKQEREYFADLGKHLILLNEGNPYGFYNKVRQYAAENGKFYNETGTEVTDLKKGWKTYKPNNPDEIVICCSDHVWLYGKEGKMSKYDTVVNYSSYYSRQLMNMKFNYTTVTIQQMESNKEKKEFTFKGQSINEKLEPSLDAAGDVKILTRDNLVVLALFSPYRYKIADYRGYDITRFKNSIRFLFILKNRRGREGLIDPLFFDGAAETFEELPLPEQDQQLERFYAKARVLNS